MSARFHRDYPIETLFDWTPGKIEIPLDWTPVQADNMVTILGRIEEHIWNLYGDDLVDLARQDLILEDQLENDLAASIIIEDDIPF